MKIPAKPVDDKSLAIAASEYSANLRAHPFTICFC
jgi:hypothetical protein